MVAFKAAEVFQRDHISTAFCVYPRFNTPVLLMYSAARLLLASTPCVSSSSCLARLFSLPSTGRLHSPALADYVVPLHVDVSMIPPVCCTCCCSARLTFSIQNCCAAVAAGTCFSFSPEGQSAAMGCQGKNTAREMLSSQEREQCRAVWNWWGRRVSSRLR